MTKQYKFLQDTISAGGTVLVYRNMGKAKHVRSMDRVSVVGGVVHVDGVSTVGKTICLKP